MTGNVWIKLNKKKDRMAPSMNAKNSCIRFLYENITKFKINLKV